MRNININYLIIDPVTKRILNRIIMSYPRKVKEIILKYVVVCIESL